MARRPRLRMRVVRAVLRTQGRPLRDVLNWSLVSPAPSLQNGPTVLRYCNPCLRRMCVAMMPPVMDPSERGPGHTGLEGSMVRRLDVPLGAVLVENSVYLDNALVLI